jgi:O-antigen ligase
MQSTPHELTPMRFFLFILANAFLFIRPSEFIAGLADVEVYRYLIIACLAVSLPAVVQQLSLRFAGVPPIVACVVMLLPAVFLSGFFHGNFELIQDTLIEFSKVLIYFLLLITLVTDTTRLRQFLRWIGLFSAAVTLIAVLRYHADIALPPPMPKDNMGKKEVLHGTFVVDDVRDPSTGEMTKVNRMCGTGIFNDPNDFALVLVTAIPMCLCWLTDPTKKATRPLWLMLLLLFGYALMLTHSRGGFLALMGGLVTLFHLKFGGKKTLLLGLVFLPVLFAVFAGRMTSISTDEGTGQARIQLWSDGLDIFRLSPLFGVGMENYRQYSSQVAHNSFIHSYTELGFIGGTLFLGAFWFAVKGLYDLRNCLEPIEQGSDVDNELRRLYPFLAAMLIAYTIGICFLSRSYIVPTYMLLGLAVVYLRLRAVQLPNAMPILKTFVWPRLAGLSCGFLIGAYTFVRMFVQWR